MFTKETDEETEEEPEQTPKEPPSSFICVECNLVFKQKSDCEKHICKIAEKLEESDPKSFKSYQQKSPDSSLVKVIYSKLSPYEQYSICYEEKYCVKDLFPPLFLSGGQRQEKNVKDYGHSKGTEFVLEVLEDQHTLNQGNGIMLDGRIKVMSDLDELLFRLPDKYLSPNSKNLKVEPRGSDFFVTLVNPPAKPIQPDKLEFENKEDSGIYDEYCDDNHVPHSFTKKETRGQNLFLQPHKIHAKLLGRYVGMTCKLIFV